MNKTSSRIISLLLSILILASGVMPISAKATLTQNEFDSKLNSARNAYPTGSQREEWSVNNVVVGWQCHGYGRWLSWYVWGVDFANGNGAGWQLKKSTASTSYINELVPGDVVRFRRISSQGVLRTWNHTIFITRIEGDTIFYTDCNSDGKCTIIWDQKISKSTMDSWLKLPLYGSEAADYGYIAHYTPNTLGATNAQPLTPPTVTTPRTLYKSGTNVSVNWNTISGNDFYQINVYRNGVLILDQGMGQSTSYTLNNAQVGDYTVYVSANNSAGSFCSTACIFTVKDISIPAKPTVSTEKTSYYQGNDIVISWTEVSGNEYYWINVYRDGNIILDKTMDGATSYTLENIQPGSYEVWVSANNLAGSSGSATCAFTVTEVKPQVQRWISYTEFGDAISSSNCELGKTYHLCYKLLEGNSGNRLDDVDDYTYQVKLTWYGADGKVFVTNTFEDDANSINMPITQPGVYRWTLEVGGDFIYSDEGTLDVKAPCTGGHKWDTGKVTTPATEKAEGVKTFTCTTCGETKTESIPKLPHTHKYTDKVTAPTCTEKGYTTHTCACGDKKVDTYVDALGHKWDDGKVTKEPTEKEEGIKTFTCSACKTTKTEPIAKLPPHAHQHTAKVTAPTCTEKGYTTHTCTCGDSYVDSYVDPVDHTWGEGVIEKEPTEAENGFKAYYCKVCGAIKGEPMDKLPHSYTATVTPPTCTEKGYTTHTCACGDGYIDTYVDALGHKWDSGKVTKEPTEKEEGVKTFTCSACKTTKTEKIAKLEPKLTITGTYTTDITMPASDLGVSAPDAVLRATLTFTEDGKATVSWEAVDLTAFKIFFHDMFVSSYYAMAYGAGITDIQQIEQFCMESTGMSVSAYMDTIVTDKAMKDAFMPPSTAGKYTYAPDQTAIYTDLPIMEVPSDPTVPNSFVVGNGTMYLNAASWDKADYTFVCTKK